MDVLPPEESLANVERSLKLLRGYYEDANDEASLFAAGAVRWRLISLLGSIADVLTAIAEWEPRDFDRYQRLEERDADWYSEAFPDDNIGVQGREAFEQNLDATSDLYVMADALRRAQILLNNARSIDLSKLELPE